MNQTYTDRLDSVCDDLTALVLEADQLLTLAPETLLEMTGFGQQEALSEPAPAAPCEFEGKAQFCVSEEGNVYAKTLGCSHDLNAA